MFQKLSQQFYIPWVDLFASRLKHQVATFVSWKPEPEAWVVDAFSINWKDIMFYEFPPFSVLGRVLSKIKEEQASGILVLPLWSTQPWFPVMLDLLVAHPWHIPPDSTNLQIRGNPAPPSQKVASFSDSFDRSALADSGLSAGSTELLSHAWREGTKLQHDTTVRRWGEYCRQWKIDTFTPPIAAVVNFLTSLFEMGLGYGAVASARSASANFVTVPGFPRLAEHLLVQKLLKGIANFRPPKPRYMGYTN